MKIIDCKVSYKASKKLRLILLWNFDKKLALRISKVPEFSIFENNYYSESNNCLIKWQTKLYDLRKKYPDELAEMHLIIESMDDDLRQMIMAKKD